MVEATWCATRAGVTIIRPGIGTVAAAMAEETPAAEVETSFLLRADLAATTRGETPSKAAEEKYRFRAEVIRVM